jgi:hypothetical protein
MIEQVFMAELNHMRVFGRVTFSIQSTRKKSNIQAQKLTPLSRVLPKNPVVAQPLKFPAS